MALPVLNTATYEMKIPSTGQKVEFRPFTVKEEKVLLTVLESNDMAQISRTLRNLIDVCTSGEIKVEDLAMFDIEYVFLKIRSKSVGENVKILVECIGTNPEGNQCKHQNEMSINIDAIELKGNVQPKTKIQLTDKVGIMMSYPKVSDVERFMKLKVEEEGKAAVGLDIMLALMGAAVHSIYDDENVYPASDHTEQELVDFLNSLNGEQFKRIQEYFNNFPKLQEKIEFDCVKCGHHNSHTLEGLADFFG